MEVLWEYRILEKLWKEKSREWRRARVVGLRGEVFIMAGLSEG